MLSGAIAGHAKLWPLLIATAVIVGWAALASARVYGALKATEGLKLSATSDREVSC